MLFKLGRIDIPIKNIVIDQFPNIFEKDQVAYSQVWMMPVLEEFQNPIYCVDVGRTGKGE